MNVYQRIAAVMQECTYVRKDQNKVANQYTAVKHDDVVAKVRPYLLKHGLVVVADVVSSDDLQFEVTRWNKYEKTNVTSLQYRTRVRVAVHIVNIEEPTDRLTVHVDACGEDPADKSYGKAISYACKYALLKTLMLETGDDPDHDASEPAQPAAKPAPAPTPAPKQEIDASDEQKAEARALYEQLCAVDESQAKRINKQLKADGAPIQDYIDQYGAAIAVASDGIPF